MGSPLRLTLTGVDDATADAAWSDVADHVAQLEAVLSRFRSTSDLTTLNRRAGDPTPVVVDPVLARALAAAAAAHRRTGGAFDPLVLEDLDRLGYRGAPYTASTGAGVAGSAGTRRRARFPGNGWLILEPRANRAAIAAPVDLGGIGKGLALRWAFRQMARRLADAGRTWGALLEAGGDLVAAGPAPQGGPWLVGIEDPAGGDDLAVISVPGGAVATSSVRVHTWSAAGGRVVHHLLDPRTGEPGGAGLASVTVAGPDPAWAEVWSKALFLQGSKAIGPAARKLGLAAWWVATDGSLDLTPAARLQTTWIDGES